MHFQEDEALNKHEGHLDRWFSNIGISKGCVKSFIFNIYLIFKNLDQKFDPILDSKDISVFVDFQEKSRKKISKKNSTN